MARSSGLDRGDHVLDGTRMLGEMRASLGFQIRPADHPFVLDRAVELDDGDQRIQLAQMIKHLGHLDLILGEHDLGLRIGQDERDILVLGARIHRRGGPAGGHDRQIGQDPLDPGAGRDRHAVLALDAERQQAGRDLEGLVLGLRPGQRDPALPLEIAEGFLRCGGFDLLEQHRTHRRRPRQHCCLGHTPRVSVLAGSRPWSGRDFRPNISESAGGEPDRCYRPRSRPISSFMISLDPAQILATRASLQARATRYSCM